MTYQTIRTNVPPVLALEDGRLVIKLIHGDLTMVADVGDGKFFFHQVVDKLIDPALTSAAQKAEPLPAYKMTEIGWRSGVGFYTEERDGPFASPND